MCPRFIPSFKFLSILHHNTYTDLNYKIQDKVVKKAAVSLKNDKK